jgi:hypothetical protein
MNAVVIRSIVLNLLPTDPYYFTHPRRFGSKLKQT